MCDEVNTYYFIKTDDLINLLAVPDFVWSTAPVLMINEGKYN